MCFTILTEEKPFLKAGAWRPGCYSIYSLGPTGNSGLIWTFNLLSSHLLSTCITWHHSKHFILLPSACKKPASGYSNKRSWDSNPGSLASESALLCTTLCLLTCFLPRFRFRWIFRTSRDSEETRWIESPPPTSILEGFLKLSID